MHSGLQDLAIASVYLGQQNWPVNFGQFTHGRKNWPTNCTATREANDFQSLISWLRWMWMSDMPSENELVLTSSSTKVELFAPVAWSLSHLSRESEDEEYTDDDASCLVSSLRGLSWRRRTRNWIALPEIVWNNKNCVVQNFVCTKSEIYTCLSHDVII